MTSDFKILPSGECFHVVRPIFSLVLSALEYMISAAVCPVIVMELILDHCIEIFRDIWVAIIIETTLRKNIRYLLPYTSLTCTDWTDSLQQFTEIIFTEYLTTLLQSFIIQHKALEHIFLQDISSPNTEMSGFCRVHTIADRNDCIKIIGLNLLGLGFSFNCTTSLSNSDSSKTLFKCLEITLLSTPNNWAIAF